MKLYKCEICGNIIEKVIDKGVPVMCCGKPMVELTANTSDGALEKHVPLSLIRCWKNTPSLTSGSLPAIK